MTMKAPEPADEQQQDLTAPPKGRGSKANREPAGAAA
jgi:hypothetical protein